MTLLGDLKSGGAAERFPLHRMVYFPAMINAK